MSISSESKTIFAKKQFACINCCNPVEKLYQNVGLTSPVIKLTKCPKCYKIADHYIEYEQISYLIDSVLLSKHAYRHIIYNTDFKFQWKLSFILLMLESFASWNEKLKLSNTTTSTTTEGFYLACIENFTECLIFLLMLFLVSLIFLNINLFKNFNFFIILCKATALGNCSKFFLLPIMIWKDNTTEFGVNIHYLMVYIYFLLSCTYIYSAITNLSVLNSGFAVIIAYFIKYYVKSNILVNVVL